MLSGFLRNSGLLSQLDSISLSGGDSTSGEVCGVLLTLHVSPLLGGRQTPDLLYSVGHVNVESAAFIRDVAEYNL